MKKNLLIACCALLAAHCGLAQTIAEKKASLLRFESEMDPIALEQIREVNRQLEEKKLALSALYDKAHALHFSESGEAEYAELVLRIRELKKEMGEIESMWRAEGSSLTQGEEYALWHQPETTLNQLIMDYGAPDYIYFIPPEIGAISLSLSSNIPIPRESWKECLELILSQYGIGIRQLNPYLKEIYILNNDPSGIKAIVDNPAHLDFFAPHDRLCYIITPAVTDPRTDLLFLQKFAHPASTKVEIVKGKIFLTGSAGTIQELLKLYTFAGARGGGQEFQLITLCKIPAKEMEMILSSAFYDPHNFVPNAPEGSSLRVICLEHLPQSLFLSGTCEEVKKAVALIRDVESQIEDPQEQTVFWYTPRHSDPEELASVLAQVYDLLTGVGVKKAVPKIELPLKKEGGKESFIVPTTHVGPKGGKKTSHKTADGQNNFIVDPKSGAIIMVVEADSLPKIKELLKKLDVPKKMVQIEVLLFEKKVSNTNQFGLNLLRLGSGAADLVQTGLNFATGGASGGILEFLISRSKGSGIPAYDMAYQFMLGQEDVQINASPSVTTMNQTPATIAIVEEVSIDSGADDKKQRIYSRAQYGITIQITPTINMDDHSNEGGFVTLETDITFDTPKKSANDRPDVTRRHIKNQVRIGDGQTVILGGLRRKNSQDNKESIPFLGEIPGIGKLFSHTDMHDDSTEMFIFITPKIIADPIQDAELVRKVELTKRPGDIPEFLHELSCAQEREKRRLFEGSLRLLFGREQIAMQKRGSEYDGR